MQWSLFLLILMGHCSFFICQAYEYYYIEDGKTWWDAQTFCRENYGDLATVRNMADMKRLNKSAQIGREAWIGLNNRAFHWSLQELEVNYSQLKWGDGEPNDAVGEENCVRLDHPDKLKDVDCSTEVEFICHEQSDNTFHFINKKRVWPEAQSYCRQHYTDLVSGHEQLEHQNVKDLMMQNELQVWIGLNRDTWRWSDGSLASYRRFDESSRDHQDPKKCTVVNDEGKWSSDDCNKKKSFFCYEDSMILVNETKNWEDALYYCRENHRDLVSITNEKEQQWAQGRAKHAETTYVWLGMRYSCALDLWFWVNDKLVGYENWDSKIRSNECVMAVAMETGPQHKWIEKPDDEKFNFICLK